MISVYMLHVKKSLDKYV